MTLYVVRSYIMVSAPCIYVASSYIVVSGLAPSDLELGSGGCFSFFLVRSYIASSIPAFGDPALGCCGLGSSMWSYVVWSDPTPGDPELGLLRSGLPVNGSVVDFVVRSNDG